jgi:hypothetical protein
MKYYHKKGFSMAMNSVISLILVLLAIAIISLWARELGDHSEELDHIRCKYSLEIAHATTIKKDVAWAELGIQAVPVECIPKLLPNELFKNAKGNEEKVSNIILDRMRVAWWASGRGKFENIWGDYDKISNFFFGGDEKGVCKALYYFSMTEVLGKESISENQFADYLESMPLPTINAPLSVYLRESPGPSNNYYVAFGKEGLVDDHLYGIFVASDQKWGNDLIIAEMLSKDELTLENINSKSEKTVCGKLEKANW